jgi:hypothetical protein
MRHGIVLFTCEAVEAYLDRPAGRVAVLDGAR